MSMNNELNLLLFFGYAKNNVQLVLNLQEIHS